MEAIVRAVDVGYGNTKFVTGVRGSEIQCGHFPSLAYPSVRDPHSVPAAERRRTLGIPINDLYYEVGMEVKLASDNLLGTHLHDRYVETPEYLALLRGALALMKQPRIDLLVVGLPVSLFATKKAVLERVATGTHAIGEGRQVEVRKAVALAQPQGALASFAAQEGRLETIAQERSLILDPGARTFDWLVARGMRLVLKPSNSVVRGVSHVLRAIADEIGSQIGTPYGDFDAIDQALRTGDSLRVYQRSFDVSKLMPIAHAVTDRAVGAMLENIPAEYTFQNIVLVGGGAFLFKRAVKKAFPKHRIHELKEPMFANVRGFQLAGMSSVASMPIGGGDATAASSGDSQ